MKIAIAVTRADARQPFAVLDVDEHGGFAVTGLLADEHLSAVAARLRTAVGLFDDYRRLRAKVDGPTERS